MNYYLEPQKKLQVSEEADVLVIGAGPAGVSAAICAAREGMKTVLVEQSGDVGGIATAGLMSHWTGETKGGIYEEILGRAIDSSDPKQKQVINPEKLKTVLLQMLKESGAKLKLYTFACDAIVENDEIKGIIIQNKSGRQVIFAKQVIDASGDGDIAASAGVPYFKGRESDGKMQPMTIMFKVAGVDTEHALFPGSFEETFQLKEGDLQQLAKKQLPFPAGHVLLYKSTLPGIVTVNMTNSIEKDGTNADDLTAATVECRQQIDNISTFLKEHVPGYENCYVISSASLIGVRETRHFKGLYSLTEQDILEARVFEDWVVTKAHFNFDVHNMSGGGLDATGVQHKFSQPKGYTIPLRSLIPIIVDNLWLAGRDISGTHFAHSNYRVMPICANMGEAVGIAASLAIKTNCKPKNLKACLVQKRLMQLGVTL